MKKSLIVTAVATLLAWIIIHNSFTAVILGGMIGLLTNYIINYKERELFRKTYKTVKTRKNLPANMKGYSEEYCKVCYQSNAYTAHDCYGVAYVTRITDDGEPYFQGQLFDGLDILQYQCTHDHYSKTDAAQCASDHFGLHQIGKCHCSYYAAPIEPHIANSKDAYVYVMKNRNLNAVKVGISTRKYGLRINEHAENGWVLVGAFKGLTGLEAYVLEQGTIAEWRVAGKPIAVAPGQMAQSGATETVSASLVNANQVVKKIANITGITPTKEMLVQKADKGNKFNGVMPDIPVKKTDNPGSQASGAKYGGER